MGISLYDATVPGFVQTVEATIGVLDKGMTHGPQLGIDPQQIVEARLHPDMLPFRFQVVSVIKHSIGAVECAQAGRFGPPPRTPDVDYAGLQAMLADAALRLKAVRRDELDALQGRELAFEPGSMKLLFTVEDFLLSFSIPNLHFHATTAYDILRMKGVPLGKRDYLGRIRVKA
ncbi:MAG: DUF1993 domain-containing protein [Pseudomonadota bacterium]|uniref:DUF1993 domain-containing protein n=1 Tax=Sinimarinibacterium flocculans TaxID=985250 RepID=UPI002EC18695|nr:DUF1993 domain-containing protein [Pseudomonadota bacterium]